MTVEVLIVDDSPIMRAVLRRTLEMCGHPTEDIYEAADGIEALKCLRGRDIAIALVDIHMPRMNGLELVRQMNVEPRLRSVIVAVVSTDAHRKDLMPFVALGVRARVRKPFSPEQVRDVFRSLVSLHKSGVLA